MPSELAGSIRVFGGLGSPSFINVIFSKTFCSVLVFGGFLMLN